MTRTLYDETAKSMLEVLLEGTGQVHLQHRVRSETQYVDLYFAPRKRPPRLVRHLGLLWQLVSVPCLVEHFSTSPRLQDVNACHLKRLRMQHERERRARRKNATRQDRSLQPLRLVMILQEWTTLLSDFGVTQALEPGWVAGVHHFAPAWSTLAVVIEALPVRPDTLWLRLLGRGTTRLEACDELLRLPENDPLRTNTLQVLAWERMILGEAPTTYQHGEKPMISFHDFREELRKEQAEARRAIAEQALKEGRNEGRTEGIETGRKAGLQEGRLKTLEGVLQARFGVLDPGLLSTLESLSALPSHEAARLSLQLTREELLERFGHQ